MELWAGTSVSVQILMRCCGNLEGNTEGSVDSGGLACKVQKFQSPTENLPLPFVEILY